MKLTRPQLKALSGMLDVVYRMAQKPGPTDVDVTATEDSVSISMEGKILLKLDINHKGIVDG